MIRSAGPSPLLLYKNHVTRAGGENRAERTTTAGWKEDRKQPRQRVTADIEAPWTHAQRPAQADVQPLSRVDTRFTLLFCKKTTAKNYAVPSSGAFRCGPFRSCSFLEKNHFQSKTAAALHILWGRIVLLRLLLFCC